MKKFVLVAASEDKIGINKVYMAKSSMNYKTQTRTMVYKNTLEIKQSGTNKQDLDFHTLFLVERKMVT